MLRFELSNCHRRSGKYDENSAANSFVIGNKMDPELEPIECAAIELYQQLVVETHIPSPEGPPLHWEHLDQEQRNKWMRYVSHAFDAYWKQREALEAKHTWRRHM